MVANLMIYEQLEKRVDGLTWKVELLSLRAGFLSQIYSILDRDFISTGPFAHGHLISPLGHLALHSTGPD